MAQLITRSDGAKIAANLRAQGKPVPAGLDDDDLQPTTPTPPPTPPTAVPPKAPTTSAVRKPRTAGPPIRRVLGGNGGAPKSRPGGSARKWLRSSRQAAPVRRPGGKGVGSAVSSFVNHPAGLGGDGGGLLITFWVYPLVLALIKYGAKGPGVWLRAKFLNQGIGYTGAPVPDVGAGPTGKVPAPADTIAQEQAAKDAHKAAQATAGASGVTGGGRGAAAQ